MLDLSEKIDIKLKTITTDAAGFQSVTWDTVATVRAAVEHKSGDVDGIESKNSRRTGSVAMYSTEKVYFTIRKISGANITHEHTIFYDGDQYDILEINRTKGRGMYIRITAEAVQMTNGKS